MIIRLQTPTSTFRIEANINDILHNIILSKIGNIEYKVFMKDNEVDANKTLSELNLWNGVILTIRHEIIKKDVNKQEVNKQEINNKKDIKKTNKCNHERTAFCLDCLPDTEPSLQKNNAFCNHPKNAMCSNCAPISQWDFDYHTKSGIKYLSFDSYIKFLKDSAQNLENLDYKMKKCMHAKNEKCINCINKAIPIIVPIYRMVDHIEIGCSESIERLIFQYRLTGREMFAVLYGKEGSYDKVPGGNKVEVKGVFVPEQENYPDGFVLRNDVINDLFDRRSEYKIKSHAIRTFHEILEKYEMKIVGCIYTNLGSANANINNEMSFVSASEIVFISHLQNKCPYFDISLDKYFNSKFVTLVLKKNGPDIELNEYMVSEQGMALIKENMLSLTTNTNIFKSDKHTFSYKKTNEYNIALRSEDSILPVDYLIVRLTHGFKHNPIFNNEMFDYNWKDKKASKYFANNYTFQKFNNLDVLIWLKMNNKFGSSYENFLDVICRNNVEIFNDRIVNMNEMVRFIDEMSEDVVEWVCKSCTFINHNSVGVCEMCEEKI